MHPDKRRDLLRLLAECDQKMLRLKRWSGLPIRVPEWTRVSQALKDLEQSRAEIEGKLGRE